MGPEIYGACGGAPSSGGSAFEPVHIEIVKQYKDIPGNLLNYSVTPDDRFVRYAGPLGDFDPDYLWPEDFPADKSPVIRPVELDSGLGSFAGMSAIAGLPAGLYAIEHSGIIDADITEYGQAFFDGYKSYLMTVPEGAAVQGDVNPSYYGPSNCELYATRIGGQNGGGGVVYNPDIGVYDLKFTNLEGYRMRMTGMVMINPGDKLFITADIEDVGQTVIFWNRLVLHKIGEHVPMLQTGVDAWAP